MKRPILSRSLLIALLALGATTFSARSQNQPKITAPAEVGATNCGQIKIGSLRRSDRLAKYNQLPSIEPIARQERGLRGHECVA